MSGAGISPKFNLSYWSTLGCSLSFVLHRNLWITWSSGWIRTRLNNLHRKMPLRDVLTDLFCWYLYEKLLFVRFLNFALYVFETILHLIGFSSRDHSLIRNIVISLVRGPTICPRHSHLDSPVHGFCWNCNWLDILVFFNSSLHVRNSVGLTPRRSFVMSSNALQFPHRLNWLLKIGHLLRKVGPWRTIRNNSSLPLALLLYQG